MTPVMPAASFSPILAICSRCSACPLFRSTGAPRLIRMHQVTQSLSGMIWIMRHAARGLGCGRCCRPSSSRSSSSAGGCGSTRAASVDEDGRRIARTRAGLGSGLELVLPAPRKPIWVNVPVVEAFAAASPFRLMRDEGGLPDLDEPAAARPTTVEAARGARLVRADDVLGHSDEPHRRPPGQLPRRLRLQRLSLLGLLAVARLQVLHDGKEPRRGRAARARTWTTSSRWRSRGARGVGLDLHAPEHRLSLRGGGPARADPRTAPVRALRASAAASRSAGSSAFRRIPVPRKVLGVRRADRGRRGPLLLLLRVRGSGVLRAALPRQGRRRSARRASSRPWSTRRGSSGEAASRARSSRGSSRSRRPSAASIASWPPVPFRPSASFVPRSAASSST